MGLRLRICLPNFCRNNLFDLCKRQNAIRIDCVRTYAVKRKYPAYPDDKPENEIPDISYTSGQDYLRQVYVWGLAEHGGLGIQRQMKSNKPNRTPRFLHRPNRLSFAEKHTVTDIACGYGFTIFAVKSKTSIKLFGTGINTDSQLGYQAQRSDAPMDMLIAPVPIELPISPTCKIKSVAAGRAHVLALVTNQKTAELGGTCFALGNNSYGQCGRNVTKGEIYMGSRTVNPIKSLDGELIASICCGQDHSIFVTPTGKVYACGWGADGQTGQGHFESESKPTRIRGDLEQENIIKVTSSADCNLAVSDSGDLFSWGNSEYGQMLCDSSITQIHTPRHIKIPEIGKVVDAFAGGSFCAVLNAKGEVWVWGYGLLGLGPEVTHSAKPKQIPPPILGYTAFAPPGYKLTSLSGGVFHLAALSLQGDLYTWGRNKEGCLGLGHTKDQPFPLRVSVGACVLKASCGIDHMAILCRPFV